MQWSIKQHIQATYSKATLKGEAKGTWPAMDVGLGSKDSLQGWNKIGHHAPTQPQPLWINTFPKGPRTVTIPPVLLCLLLIGLNSGNILTLIIATAAIAQCQVCSSLSTVAPSLNSILLQHATAVRGVFYYSGRPRGSTEKCGVGSFSNFSPSPHHAHQSPRSRYGPNCESTHTACHSP